MSSFKYIIADDDPDDRKIMNEAFTLHGSTDHLILSSAQEVFSYLQSVERDEDLPRLQMFVPYFTKKLSRSQHL